MMMIIYRTMAACAVDQKEDVPVDLLAVVFPMDEVVGLINALAEAAATMAATTTMMLTAVALVTVMAAVTAVSTVAEAAVAKIVAVVAVVAATVVVTVVNPSYRMSMNAAVEVAVLSILARMLVTAVVYADKIRQMIVKI